MAELADALDLGSSAARREGSSPFIRIFNNSRGKCLGKVITEERGRRVAVVTLFDQMFLMNAK